MAEDQDTDIGYPPDPEDGPDRHVPVPRAAQVRARALKAAGSPVQRKHKIAGRTQRKLLVQENRRQALELRKGGATYPQIAKAVGYADASGARKAVKKAMSEVTQEASQELKTLQIERYNHMLLTVWNRVQQGDDRALANALAVMDRLNELGGLKNNNGTTINIDASEHKNAVLVVDGNQDDYIAAMKRMVGVDSNGNNIPQPAQVTHAPMTPIESTVVEGKVVDIESQVVEVPPPVDAVVQSEPPPKKKFKFGVDPTVKREEGP